MQSIQEVRKACEGSLVPVRVLYCPDDPNSDLAGPIYKLGYISDISGSMVWVKFDEDLAQSGSWATTVARGMTPQQLQEAPKGSPSYQGMLVRTTHSPWLP